MSGKRILTIVLAASAVMLAVGIGPRVTGSAYAPPPAQTSDPADVTIPYPGRLTDDAGQSVADGAYAFSFALYDAPIGGEPLWSEVQESVTVQGGTFSTLLGSVNGIPREVPEGKELWLAVGVRGRSEADFTLLSPRQRLSATVPAAPAAPAGGLTCPHDHWGENWVGSTPANGPYGLRVENTGAGDALQGWAIDAVRSGVYGRHSGSGYGVTGRSTSGDGVVGETGGANKSGVYGYNTGSGYGVFGRSVSGYGGGFTGNSDHNDLFLGGAVGRINANEQDGSQLYLSSNADVIVKLDNDGGENHVFRIKNSGGGDVFTVDETGNMWASGTKSAKVETATYGPRLLYTVESPEVWFEDFGSASLVNGAVTVAFEPIFAETANLEMDYHVFVTSLCQEPVLLFVTAKTAAGFTVRGVTLDGQPAECAFDYRVVSRRLGYESLRLEEAVWQEGE